MLTYLETDLGSIHIVSKSGNKFQEFIEYPGFKYRQIKSKFNYGCFYCTGLSQEQVIEVQNKLTSYLNQKT